MIYKKYVNRLINVFSKLRWDNFCDVEEAKKLLEKSFIEYGGIFVCNRPHVGVSIIIESENKVLLMKRKGAHGEGTWSFPGGKLDQFETIEDCAIRETKEETNLDIFNIKKDKFTNDLFVDEGLHYITIFVKCDFEGEPKIMEEDKCDSMEWFGWDKLPDNLFLPLENYMKK